MYGDFVEAVAEEVSDEACDADDDDDGNQQGRVPGALEDDDAERHRRPLDAGEQRDGPEDRRVSPRDAEGTVDDHGEPRGGGPEAGPAVDERQEETPRQGGPEGECDRHQGHGTRRGEGRRRQLASRRRQDLLDGLFPRPQKQARKFVDVAVAAVEFTDELAVVEPAVVVAVARHARPITSGRPVKQHARQEDTQGRLQHSRGRLGAPLPRRLALFADLERAADLRGPPKPR
mmetsp:Transcript_14271/g.46573  ORF Transcript_14271/g.46573 Transcript_14271/m.46573 type:complete len:232 (-) Transcript_14271:48-743(-)